MSSVIGSARTSASSLFDVVTTSARTATGAIETLAQAVDVLSIKASDYHFGSSLESKLYRATARDEAVMVSANKRADLLEQMHRDNYGNTAFDRPKAYQDSLELFDKALSSLP